MSVDKKEVIMVDVDLIEPDPNQPRTIFKEEDIRNVGNTMLRQGVINPIEIDENYMIVTGEIRWRAAKYVNIKQVPCTIWKNGSHKRFERQAIENLNQHGLEDSDKEATIVKLWKTGQYPTRQQLAKAVGLSHDTIGDIIEANEFKQIAPEIDDLESVSSSDITTTRSIEQKEQRIKLLKGVSTGAIKSRELADAVKLAKTSDALLDKVLENKVPLQRALETADTIQEIAKRGVALTEDQKQNLADKVAEDETILDKYKDAVLERVKQAVTKPKPLPRIEEPISPTSPVQNIIRVKDEVMDRFRVYIGRCTMNERRWAKRTMIEIRDELNQLIDMIKDD